MSFDLAFKILSTGGVAFALSIGWLAATAPKPPERWRLRLIGALMTALPLFWLTIVWCAEWN